MKEIFTEMQEKYGENLESMPKGMTTEKYLNEWIKKNIDPPKPPKDREVHISGMSKNIN